ncbi:MBL fold metallo-hydrolase [uncultured Martelella sp.]|uniref:MBL fold metallo-hydrolase n=1 Tax=uncultured Martelella sp. TaxID=392331 RepID=UPI0029C66BA6|nr:MBL fold metallo-hydrolase [uncultured Martelella sp.]
MKPNVEYRRLTLCLAVSLVAVPLALGQPAFAADAAPVAAQDQAARIILLGTAGGPVALPDRSGIATLLQVNGKNYLFDAGIGVSRQLAKAGIPAENIDDIFITHHHLDHNASLPSLIGQEWLERGLAEKKGTVQIYGPPETKALVDDSLDYLKTSERIFKGDTPHMTSSKGMFDGHDIDKPGLVYQDENIKLTAVENSHFANKTEGPAGPDISYSYRVDTPYGDIVFTGDTGPSEAVAKLAKGADVLVSEVRLPYIAADGTQTAQPPSMDITAENLKDLTAHMETEHLSPDKLGAMANEAGVTTVILTHYAGGPADGSDYDFAKDVSKVFNGQVIAGHDLFEYDLFPPAVSNS